MVLKHRVPAALAAATIAVCGASAPALASSKAKHWTKKECESYVKSFDKKHKHPTKAQASEANKTLKKYGCKQTIK